MRICFIHRECWERAEKEKAEVYFLPYSAFGEIDYRKELKGESTALEKIALYSKKWGGVVLVGCVTDLHGLRRRSVVVAEKGKLLGVADQNYLLSEKGLRAGVGVKVFSTGAGKIGVAVGEDLLVPEVIKSLSFCGSDYILGVKEFFREPIEQVVLRASAYVYGVPVGVATADYSFGVSASGRVNFASGEPIFCGELSSEKEYRVIETRLRGFTSREK